MHAAGVQLDFAFFVRQAAVADGVVVGIVFDDGDRRDDRIERVAALSECPCPLRRAFTPFALEMISGRLPCAAGSETPSVAGAAPKSFVLPAAAVPGKRSEKKFTA